jgi:hypothetical protein
MFTVKLRSKLRTSAGLGCLALLLAGGNPVLADNIDNTLRIKAREIMRQLEERGYKNVGILKFQVKKGEQPLTLTAGKLNGLMATRLENALVTADNEDALIGLTRGASAVAAAKDDKATYLTPEGRQNLFKHAYPLAWGKQAVKVDAFLTGIVDIMAPDLTKTKVTIQAFDPKDAKPRDVLSFTVDTDLSILRDTNHNFVVRRSFNGWANANDPDEELNKLAVKDAVKDTKPGASRQLMLKEMKDYLDIQILFDGQPVAITPDGFLNKPAVGQTVLIKVKAKDRLGLLLRLNGVNTLNEQGDEKADLNDYNWWVLEPRTEYSIRGFYSDGKVRKFEARAPGDINIGTDLGDKTERHGKIEFDIFMDPSTLAKGAVPRARKPNNSFRTVTTTAPTFQQLKEEVGATLPVKKGAAARNFIVGGASEDQDVQSTNFDGRHVGGLTINYRKEL